MQAEIRDQSIRLLKTESLHKTGLLAQWDAFQNACLLDNVYIETVGADRLFFSSIDDEDALHHLMREAQNRLEHAFRNQNVRILPPTKKGGERKIDVIWFPPYPIYLNRFTTAELGRLKKSITQLAQDLELLVSDVSFSELTDGGGFEEFFYDRYFVPNQFNEMLGLQQTTELMSIPIGDDAVNDLVFDYLQDHTPEELENFVQHQLQSPYSFRISSYCVGDLTLSPRIEYFMPNFNAYLEPDQSSDLQKITELVASKFDVVKTSEVGGRMCMECHAPEGLFAETIGDIVRNAHDILGPRLLRTFKELGFEKVELQFLLHVWY